MLPERAYAPEIVTSRQWRSLASPNRSRWALSLIVVIAAGLRFWGLGSGIPANLGVDEPQIVSRSVQMMKTGSLNPHGFFDYPGLYLYVQVAVACLRFLAGATAGEWHSLNEASPEQFYLWGRAVTAALGTITVLLVYRIGLRWGSAAALFGAALMAVAPQHVRESHFVLTDVPMTFFVTMTFLLTLRAHERPSTLRFGVAGAAAGLAAATKYPGVLSVVMPLIGAAMTPMYRGSRMPSLLAAVGCAAAGFLIAAPYTLLDLPGFLNGYARLMRSYVGQPPEPGWLLYLKHLRTTMLWPAMLFLAVGLSLAIVRAVRGPERFRWALLVVFPVLYFWFISRQSLIFARYLLPIVPFICILVATSIVFAATVLRRFQVAAVPRLAVAIVCALVVLVPPMNRAIGFNRLHARRSTVELAYWWILANVPKNAAIVIETGGLQLPGHYNAKSTPQLRSRPLSAYRDTGVEYLVASSQAYGRYLAEPQNAPREYADYMNLFGQTREIVRFSPSDAHPGPELRILKVVR